MHIKNYTDHALHLYSISQCNYDEKSKKYIVIDGEKPIAVYAVIKTLRAPVQDVTCKTIETNGFYVPVMRRQLVNPDHPPMPELPKVANVVSSLYLSAIKAAGMSTEDLYTPETCELHDGKLGVVGFVGLILP